MTAIITDMAEFKARKRGAVIPELETLTDRQVTTRAEIMRLVLAGDIDPSTLPEFAAGLFPEGYDPENHPRDNYDLLVAEAGRRGVMLQ